MKLFKRKPPLFLLLWMLLQSDVASAGQEKASKSSGRIVPTVRAVRVSTPIVLDGRLDEPDWQAAPPAIGFRQENPNEGEPESEKTEIRVLYDNRALYIGARMYDREPGKIGRRLSRRDDYADADSLTIYLDPHHDHLTGAQFRVTAAGSLGDAIIYNDTWFDASWDGVWDAKVSIDSQGWVAEVQISFSQLRFPPGEHQRWGLNLERSIRRKNESDWWEPVLKKETGLASRMGHLEDLDNIPSRRHLELLPYTTARAEYVHAPSGDPFNPGHRYFGGTGLDLKWGITSNLTLDGTINPDFGQVEVDPAVVNLTAFETFYEEKRPFFLEGSNIFSNFGRSGSNNFWGFGFWNPDLFYSRRIGRSPQGGAGGDFVDQPGSTTIFGAAKLAGKTAKGWSIGLMEAVTGREFAQVDTAGIRSETEVEPLTNYLVGRLKRDVGRRASFGMMFTGVERDLRTSSLSNLLNNRAYIFGGDGHVLFGPKKDWVVTGLFAGSWLQGSPGSILRLQTNSARYFQRPDTSHLQVDRNATTLSGWDGQLNLNKNSGDVTLNAALWGVSPGFESNDMGYMPEADRAGTHAVVTWSKPNPDRWTRYRTLIAAKWWSWNFNREVQGDGTLLMTHATLLNYWNFFGSFRHTRSTFDDRLTRGGPSVRNPAQWRLYMGVGSDSRKRVDLSMNGGYSQSSAHGFNSNARLSIDIKPSSSLTISTGPEISRGHNIAQYVTTIPDPGAASTFGARYVFADLHETQLSMTTRINWIFTPKASLQVYAQPLLATGRYWGFKQLARPRSFDFLRYGTDIGTVTFDATRQVYTADPDGAGPSLPFTFGNPDFSFKSLRVNAIFRWEWRLGSTLYVVWTQQREDQSHPGEFALGRDIRSLFGARADNVFAVKLAYWLSR